MIQGATMSLNILQTLIITISTCLTTGCFSTSREQLMLLNDLYEDYWQLKLAEAPTWATYIGESGYNDKLEESSVGAARSAHDARKHLKRRLAAIRLHDVSEEERLNARIFRAAIEDDLDYYETNSHLMPMTQQDGPHITLPMVLLAQPFKNIDDYNDYAARLNAFPRQVEQLIDTMGTGMTKGFVQAKVAIEPTIAQMRVQIVDAPGESRLAEPLRQFPETMSSEERTSATRAITDAIRFSVIPSYEKMADFVENEYLPACREDAGIWSLPRGGRIYRAHIHRHTTTNMSPRQIHNLGLSEMKRIHREMNGIRTRIGFEGILQDFFQHLRTARAYKAESREQLLNGFTEILETATAGMPLIFHRLPEAGCEIKEMESFRAAHGPAAYYYPPPDDNSRPGYFYVNTYNAENRPTYTMEALTYHEAVPGHHFQFAILQETKTLPDFRRHFSINAFIEGWALYAESLGHDIGGYTDPLQEFGQLTYDAWRAARLVVDTGIHEFKWTRKQAVDYMKENTALSEINIESEVDRYIAWPGQALSYKIGEQIIQSLRDEAERVLGDDFDLRSFHDYLIAEGSLPLDLLRERMQSWIVDQNREPRRAVGSQNANRWTKAMSAD
jgi:uncharacterized protein (DUF885 family)